MIRGSQVRFSSLIITVFFFCRFDLISLSGSCHETDNNPRFLRQLRENEAKQRLLSVAGPADHGVFFLFWQVGVLGAQRKNSVIMRLAAAPVYVSRPTRLESGRGPELRFLLSGSRGRDRLTRIKCDNNDPLWRPPQQKNCAVA